MTHRCALLSLLALAACDDEATDPAEDNLYCSPTPVARVADEAVYDHWNDRILYSAVTANSGTFDQIAIRSYGAAGNGIRGSGRYQLVGADPIDCGLCLFAFQNCNDGECEKVLFADTGSVVIREPGEVGGRLSGQLVNVILKEIAFDDDAREYLPVPGGAAVCAHDFSFDVQVVARLPSATCVDGGTGSLLGDNIADFSLEDCNGNAVSLHSLCGAGAVRLMAIAGWCPACAVLVPEAELQRGQLAARGLETWYILGEADYDQRPTQTYCNDYADHHGVPPERVLLDYGRYPWETLFTHVNPYVGDTIALPWNAVLDGTNMQYVYNDPAGPGHLDPTITGLLSP